MRRLRGLRLLARGDVVIGPAPSPVSAGADAVVPAAVAAEQTWPRLRVWTNQYRDWCWEVTAPDGSSLERGGTRSHAESLARGLAHLAVHSAAWAVDVLGAELPSGWQRVP